MSEVVKTNIIFKFQLRITNYQFMYMPKDSVILHVDNQNDGQDNLLCLWVMLEKGKPDEKRHFEIIGTGQDFESKKRHHIGTVMILPCVWHVFEISNVA